MTNSLYRCPYFLLALLLGSIGSNPGLVTAAPEAPSHSVTRLQGAGNSRQPAGRSTAAPGSPALTGAIATAGVRETILPNGLKVLTKEVHSAPVVSFQVYYKVGSRNEHTGITGCSHLLE